MKFKIGDKCWYARAGQEEIKTTCPDCDGTRRIRMILANDEQISIDCGGCGLGYMGATGTITEYKFKAFVINAAIDGIEETRENTKYRVSSFTGGYYSFDEKDVFLTEEEAVERCKLLVKEAEDAEKERLLRKEKDTKSWAWNASYHRRCIKDAEKNLSYHKSKLSVASAKAKETAVEK